MNNINIKRFGLAFGTTSAILYLGCMLLLFILGKDETVYFFNTILHGLDSTNIIRTSMPFSEAVIGLIETFILGWLIGACIASIYNFSNKSKT